MNTGEVKLWRNAIRFVLKENIPWDPKQNSDKYNVSYDAVKMPAKIVYARSSNYLEEHHPEVEIPQRMPGGVRTNKFLEELGFTITEELGYNQSEKKELLSYYQDKIQLKEVFRSFVHFGNELLDTTKIEPYKIRMAIKSNGVLAAVLGMRASYSYVETDGYAQIGFLVGNEFYESIKTEQSFGYVHDFKGAPEQKLIELKIRDWDEINVAILNECKQQFSILYEVVNRTKFTNWNVEAKTTNSALKYLMFKNKTMDDIIHSDGIETLDLRENSIYKLSMGFLKKVKEHKANGVVETLFKNKLIAIHQNTGRNQADQFRSGLKIGDYVYITYGQELSAIAKIESDITTMPAELDYLNEWMARKVNYLFFPKIKYASNLKNDNRFWLPSGNSTLQKIDSNNLNEANEILFQPYYNVRVIKNSVKTSENALVEQDRTSKTLMKKNQILYGPPGTGKTYATKELAVKIADPEFQIDKSLVLEKQRKQLTEHYERLVKSGQIVFTTFHQSYSYEDFVEGIKPESIDGKINYEVKPGIIKELCERAQLIDNNDIDSTIKAFQKDIEENGPQELYTSRNYKFTVDYQGGTTFRINPENSEKENPQYPASIEFIKRLYMGKDTAGMYNPSYVRSILEHLKIEYALNEFVELDANPSKDYVLIIDEINRGNVSAIFGELITLLEEDKRKGKPEYIEVKLPYSKDMFGVPSNIYLIGTMNTADRSVEALDTALRRRFSFQEVMPDPEKLENFKVGNINLTELLKKINERVEILLDRDHTIGHSYFFKVKNAHNPEEKLIEVFRDNIIPLLQEYFYGDYSRIGLVLGDAFVTIRKEDDYTNIFASFSGDVDVTVGDRYELISLEEINLEKIATILNNNAQ